MSLAALLGVRPGLTAIIGGGGKTTLMEALGRELASKGRVILTTSAKIRRPGWLPVLDPETPGALQSALESSPMVCLGAPWPGDKLSAPSLPFSALAASADYVLVEADGSKGLPAKAHAAHEPVIPPEAANVILVLGAYAFDRPVSQVCHRPERFAALTGESPEAPLTPERWAKLIRGEGYGNYIYVNKCEREQDWNNAEALARLVRQPVVAGSLREQNFRHT